MLTYKNASRLLLYGLALIPPLVLCAWVYRFGIRVPYWDHWDFVPILSAWHEGTLGLKELTKPHNAHRPVFPYLVMLALGIVTGWEVGYELIVNLLLGVGIAAMWIVLMRRAASVDRLAMRGLLLIGLSVAVFSMTQWRNWLWGWQLQVFLCVAAALLAFVLLLHPHPRWTHLAGACAAGFVASFSFAGGLAVWPAGVVGLIVAPVENGRKRRLLVWCTPGAITTLLYLFAGAQPYRAPGLPPPDYGWSHAAFLPAALGASVVAYSGVAACVAGLIGCAAMGAMAYPLLRDRGWARESAPLAAIAAFSVGAAGLTMLGRGHEGVVGAVEARYITMTIPFWAALMLMGGMSQRRNPARWRPIVLTALIGLMALNSLYGARIGTLRDPLQADAREAIRSGEGERILEGVYPDREHLDRRRQELERLRMGPFR